jgi:GTP-binding protein Era
MKSGFVAILGKPNVGKSTLLNRLIRQKLAIVTSKPQTTRDQIRGILTTEDAQIVFIDTPGFHVPRDPLGRYMVRSARRSFGEGDLIYFIVEVEQPEEEDLGLIAALRGVEKPVFLLINKVDRAPNKELLPIIASYKDLFRFKEIIPISALHGDNVSVLMEKTLKNLPEGEKIFPDDLLSDQPTRFLVSDMVREKIFSFTHQEIPYGTAVKIDEFEERDDGLVVIRAMIIAGRDSHKGILIGKAGRMIKRIGSEARKDIEAFLGKKVYLELKVKVLRDWMKSELRLKQMGYNP